MMYCLKPGLTRLGGVLVWFLTVTAVLAQQEGKRPYSDNPGIVRKVDPNASCKFAPEYKRIRVNKTDPRVAFIELVPLLIPEQQVNPEDLCRVIAMQSEDVKAVVFDKARGFLHVLYGEAIYNNALAYFAPKPEGEGVILYVERGGDYFTAHVFTYRNGQWQDVSRQYLGPLQLTKNDYLVVPQYGRTVRLMSYDSHEEQFSPKGWITWDGTKFVTSKRPADWKCPDSYRYLPASERAQVCR